MDTPAISVLHWDTIPAELLDEFVQTVSSGGTPVRVTARDGSGVFAALEWLVPTAVIVYLGRSYFDGFLKEMGKEHYQLLKKGLGSLRSRLLGPHAPRVQTVSTGGKVRKEQPYSGVFSIMADAGPNQRFKLLLRRDLSAQDYEIVVAAFLTFVGSYHRNELAAEAVQRLATARVIGGTLLLTFDQRTGRIEPVDPIPASGQREA